MTALKKFLIAALFATIFLSCITAKANAAEDLANLLANFQSMTANFEQIVYDNKERPLQKNIGTMALKRPGQFRWETQSPVPQLLLTDGNYFWIYDIDLEQATQQKADKNNANSPASLLSGSIQSLEHRFSVSYLDTKENGYKWFRLVPNDENDMFQWIELGFEKGHLAVMRLNDKLGSLSTFTFLNVKINPSLSSSLFVFKAPKGVDVIKN